MHSSPNRYASGTYVPIKPDYRAASQVARSTKRDPEAAFPLTSGAHHRHGHPPSQDTPPSPDDSKLKMHSSLSTRSILDESWSRGKWLLGLLILQSASSFVLERYESLLREHLVITLFLTMLVGAGGNCGNQSAISVIRGLATGKLTQQDFTNVLVQQAQVGLVLGTGLGIGGLVRVLLTDGDLTNAIAIALSLFFIVVTSAIVGTVLPFGLAKVGVDPANAGSSVQVIMDVSGVMITCATCLAILEVASKTL